MIKEELFEPVPMLFGGSGNILFAKNGAKLKNIELSPEPSVIPEGQLHKELHEDFGLDISRKGIAVVTVTDDSANTLEDIVEQKDSLVQHAEVECNELIFSKSVTEFLELKRIEYHKFQDPDILLEVGKRITAELLMNAEDNTNLIETIEEKL